MTRRGFIKLFGALFDRMPLATSTTVVRANPGSGAYFYPPSRETSTRDEVWSFYRGSTRWVALTKRNDTPSTTYSVAMYKSTDEGATWSGPVGDDTAPVFGDITGEDIPARQAMTRNYDTRFVSGLDPNLTDHITVLIQKSVDLDGAFNFQLVDFSFDTETWGEPYGDHRVLDETDALALNVSRLYGYSSSTTWPIYFYSLGDSPAIPLAENADSVIGLAEDSQGIANIAVTGPGAIAYVVPANQGPDIDGSPYAAGGTGNLRLINDQLVVPSVVGGQLKVFTAPAAGTLTWTAEDVGSADLLAYNPPLWLQEGTSGAWHLFWMGSDQSIWRAVRITEGWLAPEQLWSPDADPNVPEIAGVGREVLGPRVNPNPRGGMDVTLMVRAFGEATDITVITFNVPGGGLYCRYYAI